MKDSFGREITYLRVSVTQRCNLNCVYCGKEDCAKKGEELSPKTIKTIVSAFAKCGINKVRITGGEPLVRSDICEIVKAIKSVGDIKTVTLTTNGVYLKKYAEKLKEAGLDSVNISLDSTDGSTYRHLTGADVLLRVMEGIDEAEKAELKPIKINAVLMKGVNSDGAGELINLAKERKIDVRFIELMPFSESGEDKDLMFCLVSYRQISEFLRIIKNFDGVFVYYSDVMGVHGNFDWRMEEEREEDYKRRKMRGNGQVKDK